MALTSNGPPESLVLGRLGNRLINIPKHRDDRDKVKNTKDHTFCSGFHESPDSPFSDPNRKLNDPKPELDRWER